MVVRTRQHSEAGRAGWMIFGLLAIPFLSVTSVALVADVASTTDPTAAAVGIPATLFGVLVGSLVFRLARAARSGAVALRDGLVAAAGAAPRIPEVAQPLMAGVSPRPQLVLVPARVGRRGPPVFLR